MAGRLKDKVAIVVGAGSSGPGWGNGKCTAVTFAREGARVLCVDRVSAAAASDRQEDVGVLLVAAGVLIAGAAFAARFLPSRPTAEPRAVRAPALETASTAVAAGVPGCCWDREPSPSPATSPATVS